MQGYGSHLPLFEMLFKAFKIEVILEYGMGDYSTLSFLKNGKTVHSIEMQEKQWFDKMISTINEPEINPDWIPTLALQSDAWREVYTDNQFDLVFVDGALESRPHCVNFWFNKCKIIVAHDFNKSCYHWEKIQKPDNYQLMIFGVGQRSTGVYIHNDLLGI